MKQVAKHICRCGNEAVARKKATGEWLCLMCVAKDMCNRKRIGDVYMGCFEDGSQDFFVRLVDLLPIKLYWN